MGVGEANVRSRESSRCTHRGHHPRSFGIPEVDKVEIDQYQRLNPIGEGKGRCPEGQIDPGSTLVRLGTPTGMGDPERWCDIGAGNTRSQLARHRRSLLVE